MKTLKEISTHKAIKATNEIQIWEKGIIIDDLIIPDAYLYSIPLENKDDLFSIFERYEEDNRINLSEYNG